MAGGDYGPLEVLYLYGLLLFGPVFPFLLLAILMVLFKSLMNVPNSRMRIAALGCLLFLGPLPFLLGVLIWQFDAYQRRRAVQPESHPVSGGAPMRVIPSIPPDPFAVRDRPAAPGPPDSHPDH